MFKSYFLLLVSSVFLLGANSTLQVNSTTGAIIAPVSASTFAGANGLGGGGAGGNSNYFKAGNGIGITATSGGTGTTNLVYTSYDTRPMGGLGYKSISITGGTPLILFSNNFPCTGVELGMSFDGGSATTTTINNTLISVYANGISNGFTFGSFFGTWGDPYQMNTAQRIGFPIVDTITGAGFISGYHLTEINSTNNFSVVLRTSASSLVYPNILWRIGMPTNNPNHNIWHCNETSNLLSPGSVLSISMATTSPGEADSIYALLLDNSDYTFLESEPAFILDGVTRVYYGGTEDLFRGFFYYGQALIGPDCASTDTSGYIIDHNLRNSYGYNCRTSQYRFFSGTAPTIQQSFTFANSAAFYYTNTAAVSIAARVAMFYWTQQ